MELGGTAKQGTYKFDIQSSSSQFILGDVALEVCETKNKKGGGGGLGVGGRGGGGGGGIWWVKTRIFRSGPV